MKSPIRLIVVACCSSFAFLHAAGWQPLFDGASLDGWRVLGRESWRVEDRAIVGESKTGGYGWLVSEPEYSHFVFRARFKWEGGNSGIQFRSRVVGEHVHGYQADIFPTEERVTGMLYEERGRGVLQLADPAVEEALRADGWNDYEISAIGDRIQLWLNGVKAVELRDDRSGRGVIALQIHSGDGVRVRWKDLRILEVPADARWRTLFAGESLEGWRAIGPGSWKIEDGAIHSVTDGEDWGWLATKEEFSDFILRLRFKWVKGNSGVQFRSVINSGEMFGYQADIFPARPGVTGSLYEMNGRGGLVHPEPPVALPDPLGWNDYEISAIGDHIQLFVNGGKTVDLRDTARDRGVIGFQLHRRQEVELFWKEIRVLDLGR